MSRPRVAPLLALLALACLAAPGCGGDDEPAADTAPERPALTVPRTDTEPEETTGTTETAPAQPQPAPAPGAGAGGGSPAPQPAPAPDSPQNDTPPPRDSPAERFEEFCNENPGACG